MIILTLAIGNDYRRKMLRCLDSKRAYATKHGYTYIEGGDEWWDRSRPIAWSKMAFYINYIEKAMRETPEETLWLSDADVYITKHEIKAEDHVMPSLPSGKDMLFCVDAMNHINSGNVFVRPTQRVIDWYKRVDGRTECVNHIWWENAAMLLEWRDHPEDLEWTEILEDKPRLFNAYIQGIKESDIWSPGDWLVHFAGVYDVDAINKLIDEIDKQLLVNEDK
jgi:hypothetical protein